MERGRPTLLASVATAASHCCADLPLLLPLWHSQPRATRARENSNSETTTTESNSYLDEATGVSNNVRGFCVAEISQLSEKILVSAVRVNVLTLLGLFEQLHNYLSSSEHEILKLFSPASNLI